MSKSRKSWWSSAAESAGAASEALGSLSRTLATNAMTGMSGDHARRAAHAEQERLGLLRELKTAVRATIEEASARSKDLDAVELDERDEVVRELLVWLERCLWHGLREEAKVRRKSPDGSRFVLARELEVSPWNCAQYLAGPAFDERLQALVADVRDLLFVRTVSGKGRAWVRLALNEKVLDLAVSKLAAQPVVMQVYYESYALMRNEEASMILASMLSGLNGLDIKIHVDIEALDTMSPPLRGASTLMSAGAARGGGGASRGGAPAVGAQSGAAGARRPNVKLDMAAKSLQRRAAAKRKRIDQDRRKLARTVAFLGSPLELQVQTISVSALAYQEPCIAVPNILLRAVALFWEYSPGEFEASRLFAVDDQQRAHVVDAKRKLDKLRGDGLTIFSRVDVDVDLSTAMASMAATTRAGLSERLQPEVVGGVIVAFLQGLPTSLVPQGSYEPLLLCAEIDDAEARQRNIGLLIETFPLGHRAVLDLLARTLDHLFGSAPEVCDAAAAALAPVMLRPAEGLPRQPAVEQKVLGEVFASHVECLGKTRQDLGDMRARLADKWARLRRYRDDMATPVREDTHKPELDALWALLEPEGGGEGDAAASGSGRDWRLRGGQSQNIADDFRGGGKFALDMVTFFVKAHGAKARQIAKKAQYPLLRGASQVARLCSDVLQLSVQDHTTLPETPWWILLSESDAVPRVYCMSLLLLDINYSESGATVMDFGRVAQETRVHMSDLLSLAPTSVNKLWHSWIQLRAERMLWAKSISGGDAGGGSGNLGSSAKREPHRAVAQPPSGPKTAETAVATQASREGQEDVAQAREQEQQEQEQQETGEADQLEQEASVYDNVDMDQLLPIVVGNTETLSKAQIAKLEAALPSVYQGYDWKLVFASSGGDRDIGEFYEQADSHEATLLVVRDKGGAVFGGFCPRPWALGNTSYYGSPETFLFTLEPSFAVYRASQQNAYFMLANEDSLALGGGGEFGLFLDEDFLGGTSGPCDTFSSPCLASETDFSCVSTELFALQVRKRQ